MIYTGQQDALPHGRADRLNLTQVLGLLDQYDDAHGITYNATPVIRARDAAARADELRAAWRTRTKAGRDDTAAAGRAYLEKRGTAADVVTAALQAAPLDVAEVREAGRKLVEHAAAAVEAEGVAQLRRMTEDGWLRPVRPLVAEHIALAHKEAEAVGVHEPRPMFVGVRKHGHPWTPSREALRTTATRHAWERLGEAIESLHQIMGLPEQLRALGLLPAVPGRTIREDYRWLHPGRLTGNPSLYREFWLMNRHTAEPGVWTADEMREADVPPVESDGPDATSASDELENVTA